MTHVCPPADPAPVVYTLDLQLHTLIFPTVPVAEHVLQRVDLAVRGAAGAAAGGAGSLCGARVLAAQHVVLRKGVSARRRHHLVRRGGGMLCGP